MIAFLLLLISSLVLHLDGSEACKCVPARRRDIAASLAWLPKSFCCNSVKSISSISGITCSGEGPFEDEECSVRLKAGNSVHEPQLLGLIGYHEGARRVVSCSGDGKIIGVRVGWNQPDGKDNAMYGGRGLHLTHLTLQHTTDLLIIPSERFISEIQVLCSTNRLDLSHGSREINPIHNLSESTKFGASMHNASDHQMASCSDDGSSSVVGFKWRETTKKSAGAARVSGMTVLCSLGEAEDAKHSVYLKGRAGKMQAHDRSFRCSDLTSASNNGSLGLRKIGIWFHARSLAGLDFIECS